MDFKMAYKWITSQKTWNLSVGNNTIGNITIYKDEVIILFQYTFGFWDWVKNFMAWPFMIRKPYKKMPITWKVHWGFFKDYKMIRNKILTLIKNNNNYNITIIGYSRGAALATYCAEDIAYNCNFINLECITFGGANCLDSIGRIVVKNRVQNHATITYGNDIVTKVPFWFVKPDVIYQCGPKRKWWKFSFKDHDGYKTL